MAFLIDYNYFNACANNITQDVATTIIMKDLIDLVHIVTKPKLRTVELIHDAHNSSSKLAEFYHNIASGQFQDDDDAASYLYQADKNAPVYQKLRKNLRDRLINSLFLIDLKQASYTDRQKAYYECCKEWAAVKILFGKNAHNAAIAMARKVLKLVRKFEFTELNVDICHTLRLFYGTIDGDFSKYQQYDEESSVAEQLWVLENRAERYYIDLSIGAVNSKATKTEYQAKARQYYKELVQYLLLYNSYQLHFCTFLIESGIYSSVNDYQGTIQVCDRAIQFFLQKEYKAAIPLQVFLYQKAICLVQLRDFEGAKKNAEECLKHLDEGTFNWFKTCELSFTLGMHEGNYDKSRELLALVLNHGYFDDLPENIQGFWKIAEAYLHYLVLVAKLGPATSSLAKKRKFRPSKFFNELRVFTTDKQGMNIHLIFLEILFFIANRQFEELIDRVEALDKYRIRYLQELDVRRCNYFLKMLLLIPKCAFNKALILQKTEPDYQALLALPIELANQTFEIEILPYEKIWADLMDFLS